MNPANTTSSHAETPRHESRFVTRTIRLRPGMSQGTPMPTPSGTTAEEPAAPAAQAEPQPNAPRPGDQAPPVEPQANKLPPMTVDADGVVYPEPPQEEPVGSPLAEPPPLLRPNDAPPRVHADGPPERPMPPTPPEPDCFLMAMFYLAEEMAQADGVRAISEQQTIDGLAGLAGVPEFRSHPWYRALNEDLACAMLQGELLQMATLVLLSLVLKADGKRLRTEHDYFTRIRQRLGAAPITVPINVDRHRYLALKYLRAVMGLD